jgi:hypothetical protein
VTVTEILTVDHGIARRKLVFFCDTFPAIDNGKFNHVGAINRAYFMDGANGCEFSHGVYLPK